MTEDQQPRKRNLKRFWLALAALAVILAILIVPPFLSVSRYKARITQLIATSLGRPVRLSSVKVRLLPRPGFVLSDLTVEELPAYGAEPVLHASTVTASIRLLSLWRGRLEIDTISVDEASLNLVRNESGRWNLDSLLRTATAQPQLAAGGAKAVKLPYLEATNSRINVKNGSEKLPFSLLDADLSFWQQNPGDWRLRLRGQPVRTDLSIQDADTGTVRIEAQLRQSPQLRQMPMHIDLEWREAQLGQLSRLLLGSDAGWRGDLTGELHMEGTAEAAQIKTRLRAAGVHRAEFAPAAPMDFDANCTFLAHFSARTLENLVCDSPLGSGHVRLTGNQAGAPSSYSVELDKIPVAAGLDALRTVRSGLAPGLVAAGSISGKLLYAPQSAIQTAPQIAELEKPAHSRSAKAHAVVVGPLTGSLGVDGLQLSGSGLSQPILIPKLLLEPAPLPAKQTSEASDAPQELAATVAIPAGAAVPLTVAARLALSGYQVTVRGQASIRRAKDFAHIVGITGSAALDALAGDALAVDLAASGPWSPIQSPAQALPPASAPTSADSLTGTITLRNANWKADYLANAVEISQATLHLDSGNLLWDPVAFSYGPVKGTASLALPAACAVAQPSCQPTFQVQFGVLDASVLQAAFLGAQKRGTMLSTLIERLRPTAAPAWPHIQGTVKAESLILGPVTFHNPTATLSTLDHGAEISAFDAALLGGRIHASGAYHAAITAKDKPSYQLEGQLEKLTSSAVGQLLGLRASGGLLDGNGKIELSGFTADDLASSAKGSLHFDWQRGAIAASGSIPPALVRFDRWTADADVANGSLTLKQNQLKRGFASQPVQAAIPMALPPRLVFAAAPKAPPAKK